MNRQGNCSAAVSCSLSLLQRYILVGRGARVRGNNPKRQGGSSQAHIPPFPFRFFPRAPISSFPFPLRREPFAWRKLIGVRCCLTCVVLMNRGLFCKITFPLKETAYINRAAQALREERIRAQCSCLAFAACQILGDE